MVKHMIIWKFKDEIQNKAEHAGEIKSTLEGLVGKIDGLCEMHILIEKYDCSAGDVMMDSTFENKEALDFYQSHPKHKAIADGIVRPCMEQRLSFDYEI